MNFYEKLKRTCKFRKITLKEMGRLAGLGANSWQNWTDHGPTAENLLSISKVLNTTMEYLMGETDDIDAKIGAASSAASMTVDERELLSLFRSVSVEGKAAIMASARAFAGQLDYTKKESASTTA